MIWSGCTCILDTETGGFSPEKNLLTEISFVMLDENLKRVEEYSSYIYPYDKNKFISADASKLTGITLEKVKSEGRPLEAVINEIKTIWLKYKRSWQKVCLVGHNIKFDLLFLKYVFALVEGPTKTGENPIYNYIDEIAEDTMRLAQRKYRNNEVPDFKLNTLAQHLGFTNALAHEALNDVYTTEFLYLYFMDCLKGEGNGTKKQKRKFNFQF